MIPEEVWTFMALGLILFFTGVVVGYNWRKRMGRLIDDERRYNSDLIAELSDEIATLQTEATTLKNQISLLKNENERLTKLLEESSA